MTIIYLAHVVSTVYMTGLIWFVQIVHYPLMNRVGGDRFTAYEKEHQRLTSYVVGPPMLVEALTAVYLVMVPAPGMGHDWGWIGLGRVGVVWLATAYLQVPEHNKLAQGFQARSHGLLVSTNWLRTVAWSIRTVWVLWPLAMYMAAIDTPAS